MSLSSVVLLSLLILLLLLAVPSLGTPTCFEDGVCVDLRTYVATKEVRAQYGNACANFEPWLVWGLCDLALQQAATDYGPHDPYLPDYAAVWMYAQGVMETTSKTLRALGGMQVPVTARVPLLLTSSGINVLAQNASLQGLIQSRMVSSGQSASPRCPMQPEERVLSGRAVNQTWVDWGFKSTSRGVTLGLSFAEQHVSEPAGAVLYFIVRAPTLAGVQQPRGIGAYIWPLNAQYAWQYEVTMPPGVPYHSFHCVRFAWCQSTAEQPTYNTVMVEFMYVLSDQEQQLLSAAQEAELLTEMRVEFNRQLSMCWPMFCPCVSNDSQQPPLPAGSSEQEPLLNATCSPMSRQLDCPLAPLLPI
eukprot:CAMPEP_0177650922 /NCGR_PEP_ID=MMETSP0447-20121125/12231_1 /TAXON_ID=0 /ORGANISM="Stygamoeba regulata, Strain BSH-02190019" /LENGTH=359 /DNA_ID=CAMNT_0019153885 /DNA_START=167 /DNA_END=1246 /DNA_ORIENTATION=-